MRISRKSQYALAAVLDLTLHAPKLAKVPEIAFRNGIPLKFLELILSELKHRGFVAAKRGCNGGYVLAKTPDLITLGQVLASFGERKPRRTRDGLAELWSRVDQTVWTILDGTTFADIATQWEKAGKCEPLVPFDLAQAAVSVTKSPADRERPAGTLAGVL